MMSTLLFKVRKLSILGGWSKASRLYRTQSSAVKKAREYLSKPQFKDYVIEEYGPIAQLHSDEEIEAYVRAASSKCTICVK